MTDTLRVAVVQMSSSDRPNRNLEVAERLCREAAADWAELIVLPEHFLYRGERAGLKLISREAIKPAVTRLAQLAGELQCWIVASGLPVPAPRGGKLYNTTVVINAHGQAVMRYQKMHLFDPELPGVTVASESLDYLPGDNVGVVEIAGRKTGIAVCYDVRFPELFRIITASNCVCCLVPANFTFHTGKAHWEILLRARAIENQMFIVAAGQAGTGPDGARSFGHSMIVGPWGEVLGGLAEKEDAVLVTDLDFDYLRRVRSELPVLKHRRSWRWMRGRM